MPLGKNVRFRVRTFPSGKKVRLAFRGGRVIETKSLQTGEVSTMKDVLARRRRKKRRAS